jgi:hypothetical protein
MPTSRFNPDSSVTTVTDQALIGVTNSSETVTDTVTPLHIALEPTGTGKRTRMDHDDYDAPTTVRVDAIAAKIKADGKDKYDYSRQYIDSVSIGSITGKGRTVFLDLSNSDSEYGLGIDIIKGSLGAIDKYSTRGNEVNSDNIDGPKEYSRLLGDINSDPQGIGGQQMATKITNLQNKHNSTSADNVFLPIGRSVDETTANVGMRIIPGKRGTHEIINNLAIGSIQENRILPDDMLNLGIQIPVKSAGEWYVPKFGANQTHGNRVEQITLAVLAAMVPNPIKALGQKRPVKELSAKSVLNSVRRDNLQINNAEEWPSLSDNSVLTHGSYYTWLVPFEGFLGKAQVPGTILLIMALSFPVLGMAGVIWGLGDDPVDILTSGFPTREDNYVGKVMVGFLHLFGARIDKDEPYSYYYFWGSLLGLITTERIWKEYNLFNTIARRVIRDITENTQELANNPSIVDSADKAWHFLTQSSVAKFVRMLHDLGNAVHNAMDKEKQNKIDKNIFAKSVYDENSDGSVNFTNGVINSNESWKHTPPYPVGQLISNERVGKEFSGLKTPIRRRDDLVKKHHGTNNEHDSSPLTWGAGTTPSMYLLPETISTAADLADGSKGTDQLNLIKHDLGMTTTTANRFSSQQVKDFEEHLNASYMPFYLQDLRTNEIISFHAFIENMSDSFSANYDSTTAFGRIEPIHIYKNSSRDMGMSFTVVATNAQDHSEMWWKINKLLTLVYPQFTKGRELISDKDKFIQPYSQLIGASPMVRLRVGDVWKTNYSKFNVMRLFGLGETEFNLNDAPTINAAAKAAVDSRNAKDKETARVQLVQRLTAASTSDKSSVFLYEDEFILTFVDSPNVKVLKLPSSGRAKSVPGIIAGIYNARVLVSPAVAGGNKKEYTLSLTSTRGADVYTTAVWIVPTTEAGTDITNNRTGIPSFSIKEDWITTKLTQFGTDPAPSDVDALSQEQKLNAIYNFFKGSTDREANPIMQAFESTAGEGIAGFISSIGIDWNGSRWETEFSDEDNARAPQMCKIDLKFLPVHDITPGLASNGFMTAPVYTVGKYANAFKKIKT